jgi:hypothetical protein
MLIEDVYNRIQDLTSLPLTLDDLNTTPRPSLQALDYLLHDLEASRNAAREREVTAQAKVCETRLIADELSLGFDDL